jgi:hypothetical protein
VPVRLELAALAAGVPLPRPCLEEVAAAVVSWSAGVHGELDERVALALVEGYRRAGGALQVPSPTVLAGELSWRLARLDRWMALLR